MVGRSERKPLRSCARCRKNKIKCDSMETRPGPCSACLRKGVECNIDYVSPPQRSREMKLLCDNIRYVKERISTLYSAYEKQLKEVDEGVVSSGIKGSSGPTRVLKILDKFYVLYVDENAGSFYINDVPIKLSLLKTSFNSFKAMLSRLLKIYFKWDGLGYSDMDDVKVFLSRFNVRSMLEDNQLLLLLCILNFYFDIPGLNYLEIYDHVVESYCQGACDASDEEGELLGKSLLAKLIIGDYHNCHFHSELFIKHFTIYLFLHVVLYGTEHFMACFMDKYIRTLECIRKKINFNKNWEVKWANFYIRLLNLVEQEIGNGEEYTVDEMELKSMFNGIVEGLECDWASCLVCVIKFDQYLIERRSWPKENYARLGLPKVLENLKPDLLWTDNGELCERRGFLDTLLCQLLNLNEMLCVNNCNAQIESPNFLNGFTYEPVEFIDGEQVVSGNYMCQRRYSMLKKCCVNLNDDTLRFSDRSVGKHYWRLTHRSAVDVVKSDFEAYLNHEDMSLRILKSCCCFIWSLYEFAIYYEMLDRVMYYEPFTWNPQVLLENNGLACQGDDDRVKVQREEQHEEEAEEPIEKILENVNWITESADDVLRKIHGVLD